MVDHREWTIVWVDHQRMRTYRQWFLGVLVLWLGDVQSVDEALQLLPEGLHLGADPVE